MSWLDKLFGSKDSKDRTSMEAGHPCNMGNGLHSHDYEWSESEDAGTFPAHPERYDTGRAEVEAGHVVIPVVTEMDGVCQDCGDTVSRAKLADGHVAVPVSYRLDEGTSLKDAETEPVDKDEREDGAVYVNTNTENVEI